MFGTGQAIRERFDNVFMDYRNESQVTADIRWNDRITYDGNEREERSAYSVMNVRRSVRPKHCIKKWSWRYSCNGKVEFCTYTKK